MNKLQLFLFLLLSATLVVSAQDSPKKFGYVGVDDCGMCHKTEKQGKQLDIWKNSKHAKAYETLKTEQADKIAKDLGFETPAVKTPKCLKCHASGYDTEPALLGKKFKVEDGVQCETCHGPGSEYKAMKIMKSREESIKNGLIVHDKFAKFCVNCHNAESPTYIAIDVNEAWRKIKHPVPTK